MDNLNIQQTEQLEIKQPRQWLKSILRPLIITIVLGSIIYFTPTVLGLVLGADDTKVNDEDLLLPAVNVPKAENAYFDLIRLGGLAGAKPEIQIEIPDGIDDLKFLDSFDWDINLIAETVNKNETALNIFSEASDKPQFQYDLTADPANIKSMMPVVAVNSWRQISRLSAIKAIYLLRSSAPDNAFAEAIKSVKIGHSIETSKNVPLITFLVGIAMKRTGIETVQALIAHASTTPDILNKYQIELAKYSAPANPDPIKLEYMILKDNFTNLKGGKYETTEIKQISYKNNFYFKLNKSINLAAENYRQFIKEFVDSCDKSPTASSFAPIPVWKMYLMENSLGKPLTEIARVALKNVKTKRCDLEASLLTTNKMFADAILSSGKNVVSEDTKLVDSDVDGLTDFEETSIYKSDPNKQDTDGDGYLDGKEVAGGFNPNGTGKLIISTLSNAIASSTDPCSLASNDQTTPENTVRSFATALSCNKLGQAAQAMSKTLGYGYADAMKNTSSAKIIEIGTDYLGGLPAQNSSWENSTTAKITVQVRKLGGITIYNFRLTKEADGKWYISSM